MKVFINNEKIAHDTLKHVVIEHRGWDISIGNGGHFKFTDIVIFPPNDNRLVNDLANRQFPSVTDAIDAINKLQDALDMGFISFEE